MSREPKGILKIKEAIKEAKVKGYTLALVKGAFKSFVKAKQIEALPYSEQLNRFNTYLKKYGLACISTRKGILFGYKADIKENYRSNNGFEW